MSSYSIRSLEVFSAVAEAGSFSAAAERLQISQPSVSEHVRKLEQHLSQTLFRRERGRPAALTEAGQRLLDDARALLNEAQRIHSHASHARREQQRQIAVSCHRPLAQAVLARHFAAFAAVHPGTELLLHTGSVNEVVERVQRSAADLGVFLARQAPLALRATRLGSVDFVIVAGAGHALAQRRELLAAELNQHAFLTALHHSQYVDDVSAMLAAIGIGPRQPAARVTEFSTLLQMTAAGVGLLCAIRQAVQPEIDAGRLVALPLPAMSMSAWVAHSPSAQGAVATQALGRHLAKSFAQSFSPSA